MPQLHHHDIPNEEFLRLGRTGYVRHYVGHSIHKLWVLWYLLKLAIALVWRGIVHDWSKYTPSEAKGFASSRYTKPFPYGHQYCRWAGQEIKSTILLHKQRNRHHPEFHKNRVNGMTLVDFCEMVCDWKAASRKNANGSFEASLEANASRYSLNKQVFDILRNS